MDNVISIFDQVFPNPLIKLVSLMDHTPGQRQWRDLDQYRIMEMRDYQQDKDAVEAHLLASAERQKRNYAQNRKALMERVCSHAIALASHDDSTIEHIDECHSDGIVISEFPTTMEAAKEARARGMKIVAGSPNLVLGGSHSGNVSVADLAREGVLDALASDYVPSSLLEGAFLLHAKVGMNLPAAVATVTLNPARMAGLDDRGSVETGQRADLIRVRVLDGMPVPLAVWRQGMRIA
jgi:alpha-D-ribose 1-methylphosphonate 5-triphosphate diphosphatase